jgi:hypothetical protein
MGLGPEGPTLYTFGHGDMYYDIWDLLSKEEQDEVRLQMQENIFTTPGVDSPTTVESSSRDTQYIWSEERNTQYEHFTTPSFYTDWGIRCVTHHLW